MAVELVEIVGWAVFGLLQALGWFMATGGIGRLTANCKEAASTSICGETYRAEWWTIMFQLFCLVLVAIASATTGINKMRVALSVFIAISCVRLMYDAEESLKTLDSIDNVEDAIDENDGFNSGIFASVISGGPGTVKVISGDAEKHAVRAHAGGVILMALVNFVLLLFIGSKGHPEMPAIKNWIPGRNAGNNLEQNIPSGAMTPPPTAPSNA